MCGRATDILVVKDGQKICLMCNDIDQEIELKKETIKNNKIEFYGKIAKMGSGRLIWIPKPLINIVERDIDYRITLREVGQ